MILTDVKLVSGAAHLPGNGNRGRIAASIAICIGLTAIQYPRHFLTVPQNGHLQHNLHSTSSPNKTEIAPDSTSASSAVAARSASSGPCKHGYSFANDIKQPPLSFPGVAMGKVVATFSPNAA